VRSRRRSRWLSRLAVVASGLALALASAASASTPTTGFTMTATSMSGTLTYQGVSTDRGTPVLLFVSDSVTLDGLQLSTPCQTTTPGVTATEFNTSTALSLQSTAGSPVQFLLTSLSAAGSTSAFTTANPPPTGYTLDSATSLDISGTLITAPTASGQTTAAAVIC
jgi:hypothetical protein